jgi:hypothetical protein
VRREIVRMALRGIRLVIDLPREEARGVNEKLIRGSIDALKCQKGPKMAGGSLPLAGVIPVIGLLA